MKNWGILVKVTLYSAHEVAHKGRTLRGRLAMQLSIHHVYLYPRKKLDTQSH